VNAPSSETSRFIARILGARATPPAELAAVIAALNEGLAAVRGGAQAVAPPAAVVPAREAERPAPTVIKLPMRRQRRRLERPAAVAAPVVETAVEPPAPRLLRRAQVPAPEPTPLPAPVTAAAGTVRGVVKWFDSKAGKGAIRLTGISGDLPLDPALLQRAGIRRLYKDQEIEAAIEGGTDRVRLVDLFLPGRAAAAGAAAAGLTRRTPRQVTVEVKRDGVRLRQARAEAEQVLGAKATVRLPRRFPTT